MKMKLIFCEKKARKPLVSLEKNIAEHFCSAMMVGAGGFEPGVTHQLQPDFEKSPAFFMPISRIVEFSALIPEKFNQQKLRGRFVCIDRYMQSDLFFISADKGGKHEANLLQSKRCSLTTE